MAPFSLFIQNSDFPIIFEMIFNSETRVIDLINRIRKELLDWKGNPVYNSYAIVDERFNSYFGITNLSDNNFNIDSAGIDHNGIGKLDRKIISIELMTKDRRDFEYLKKDIFNKFDLSVRFRKKPNWDAIFIVKFEEE